MKVKESELREIAQAFVSVGLHLDATLGEFRDGQIYQARTNIEIARNAYRECRQRLKIVLPDIYWGER